MNEQEAQIHFEKFESNKLDKYDKLPADTLEYYKKEIKEGRNPLRFYLTPHILYNWHIYLKDGEIIEVQGYG